jgi:cell wall-associated NlpC family hydrolase
LLFGDYVQILQKTEKWYWVQSDFDEYQGWVDFRQLAIISEAEYLADRAGDYLVPAVVQNVLKGEDGTDYYLAAGSSLPQYAAAACYLGKHRYNVSFQALQVEPSHAQENIAKYALFFLNAPYLWGGRTLFGIDCSGFVQIVFKMAGIKLKRDASQQALAGATVDFLSVTQAGDVAFFDNEQGRITHVGILLSNKEIIHASAKVRIDPIDDQGIFNKELNRYTHNLRIIKRFF